MPAQFARSSATTLFAASLFATFPFTHASASGGCWSNGTAAPVPLILPQCTEFNGLIYVLAGLDSYDCTAGWLGNMAYDPATNTWRSNSAIMPTTRYNTAAAVVGAYIYVLGGSTGCGSRTAANEAYDPVLNTWLSRAPMLSPRSGFAASAINGIVYVTGGTRADAGPDTSIDTLETYNPATNSWAPRPHMLNQHASHASVSYHGRLYVFGGYDAQNLAPYPEVFDPATNAWRLLPQMPRPRSYVSAVEVDGRILIMGGVGPDGISNAVDVFDPILESWVAPATSLPTPRSVFGSAVVDGVVYTFGGWTQPPTFTATTQILHLNCSSCPADFNNDGSIDFFDYLDFVDAFSTGC